MRWEPNVAARGVLEDGGVHVLGGEVDVAHDGAADEAVLHRGLPTSNQSVITESFVYSSRIRSVCGRAAIAQKWAAEVCIMEAKR